MNKSYLEFLLALAGSEMLADEVLEGCKEVDADHLEPDCESENKERVRNIIDNLTLEEWADEIETMVDNGIAVEGAILIAVLLDIDDELNQLRIRQKNDIAKIGIELHDIGKSLEKLAKK